ncbi:MAG: hypothetical protein ACTSYF_11235, partial [Promethearchaeota archaeon]
EEYEINIEMDPISLEPQNFESYEERGLRISDINGKEISSLLQTFTNENKRIFYISNLDILCGEPIEEIIRTSTENNFKVGIFPSPMPWNSKVLSGNNIFKDLDQIKRVHFLKNDANDDKEHLIELMIKCFKCKDPSGNFALKKIGNSLKLQCTHCNYVLENVYISMEDIKYNKKDINLFIINNSTYNWLKKSKKFVNYTDLNLNFNRCPTCNTRYPVVEEIYKSIECAEDFIKYTRIFLYDLDTDEINNCHEKINEIKSSLEFFKKELAFYEKSQSIKTNENYTEQVLIGDEHIFTHNIRENINSSIKRNKKSIIRKIKNFFRFFFKRFNKNNSKRFTSKESSETNEYFINSDTNHYLTYLKDIRGKIEKNRDELNVIKERLKEKIYEQFKIDYKELLNEIIPLEYKLFYKKVLFLFEKFKIFKDYKVTEKVYDLMATDDNYKFFNYCLEDECYLERGQSSPPIFILEAFNTHPWTWDEKDSFFNDLDPKTIDEIFILKNE